MRGGQRATSLLAIGEGEKRSMRESDAQPVTDTLKMEANITRIDNELYGLRSMTETVLVSQALARRAVRAREWHQEIRKII